MRGVKEGLAKDQTFYGHTVKRGGGLPSHQQEVGNGNCRKNLVDLLAGIPVSVLHSRPSESEGLDSGGDSHGIFYLAFR